MQEDKLEKAIILFQEKDDGALGHQERGRMSMDGTDSAWRTGLAMDGVE